MQLTYTLKEIPEVASKVLEETKHKIVLFYGDMGVGKTTLIKELAKKLGVKDGLSSPTFSIVNEHQMDNGLLYHFDFYRLQNEAEAFDIGVEEYFYSGHWNFIEWPQIIEKLLPINKTTLKLTLNKDGSRTLNMISVK